MDALYFEDFKPGDRFESAGKTLSEAEILDFAWRYDPQPIHMDKVAAEAGPYGGLIASGFQTLLTSFRLLWQTNLLDAASLGSPGIEELKWTKPVRPGDTLHTVIEVLVENGATLNVTNNEGRTPLALAMVGSRRLGGRYAVPRKSTVDLLRALGATE